MEPNLQETADLVTLTEEILNLKTSFFCEVRFFIYCVLETRGHQQIPNTLTALKSLKMFEKKK